jgi:DNA repair exonuclease SbcCD ATPase subunit
MIYFRKLRWKNFLSTGNQFTEILLDKSPTTLVIGGNGSGKSTMLDALTFALFGKPFRNINKPNIINSINDKECVVEVEFRIGTKEYKVVRGLKPAIFTIHCDGVAQDQDAKSRDYQDYLETHILKFNYKAFTQIVLLGSSSFVPFMQLNASDRRAIIEELLDIKIFSSMNLIVKTRLNNIKITAGEIKANLDSTMSKIELQKKYVEEAKKNNSEHIEKKTIEKSENEKHVEDLMRDMKNITLHVTTLAEKVCDEASILTKLKTMDQFGTKIDTKITKAEKELKFFTDNDNCPTCTQKIDEIFKSEAIEKANTSLTEFRTGLTQLEEQQDKLNTRLSDIKITKNKINEHKSELTRLHASVVQIQRYIQKLEAEIEELRGKKVLSDDMTQVSETLVNTLEELDLRRKDILEIRQYFDIAALLLKDNGIKTKIIKQYLPVINKLINKYLAAMDFFVNFEIDEEFKETIKSRHRDAFSYENFSEGEKMRIDLALLFTWRSIAKIKNSMSTNLLVLDEVFDSSLDNSGTEEFMKLLNTLGSEYSVFVISHKGDILIDKFKSVIKFEKVKNFSQVAV